MFFTDYERLGQPLASRGVFLRRLGRNLAWALGLIALSLAVGTFFYYFFLEDAEKTWPRAFDGAAMILSGMGPLGPLRTSAGQIFEGCYALYSGLLLVATSGVILAPVFHRVLHGLHVPDEEEEQDEAKGKAGKGPKRRAAKGAK